MSFIFFSEYAVEIPLNFFIKEFTHYKVCYDANLLNFDIPTIPPFIRKLISDHEDTQNVLEDPSVENEQNLEELVASNTLKKIKFKTIRKKREQNMNPIHSFFENICVLKLHNHDKSKKIKCVRAHKCSSIWMCDRKCHLKKEIFSLCFNKNKNCFKDYHEKIQPKGHYPSYNAENHLNRICVVCKTRTLVVCSECNKRFCLSSNANCFYSVDHEHV